MTKQERRDYIAAVAKRIQQEKARERELYDIETETEQEFKQDNDIMSIENIDGFITTGLQKITGGFRKLPVIIL